MGTTARERYRLRRAPRNVFCPKYSECLWAAVELELAGWSCEGCMHMDENAGIGETDFSEYYWLLHAIFKPEMYTRSRLILGEEP